MTGLDEHPVSPQIPLTVWAARRLHALAATEYDDQTRRKVAQCLLDHLGACVAALHHRAAPPIGHYLDQRAEGSKSEAVHWGQRSSMRAEEAAFGNSVLGHALIRDDMHVASGTHIGSMVVPAAIALAQREQWSGRQLVRALIGGYDMAVRLGTAIRPGSTTAHFRPSGINGAFGVVAAAIAATDPHEDVAVNALGLAANAAAGVNEWPWAGGQEVYTHLASAARNGLVAFDLAVSGFRASASALDGRDGMFAAYGADSNGTATFIAPDSADPLIRRIKHKPYSGCNLVQTPLAAAIQLHSSVADRILQIDSVTIHTFALARDYPGCNNTGPFQFVEQSKMSLQFAVSAALARGQVDEDAYRAFADPHIAHLIDRCQILVEPKFTPALARMEQPVSIEIRTLDGRNYSAELDDVPWLDENAVIARFRREVGRCCQQLSSKTSSKPRTVSGTTATALLC